MQIAGAVPYGTSMERDNTIKELKDEFDNKITITVDRVLKIINYHSYTQKTMLR